VAKKTIVPFLQIPSTNADAPSSGAAFSNPLSDLANRARNRCATGVSLFFILIYKMLSCITGSHLKVWNGVERGLSID
jgi:hypothetical protein